MQEGLRGHKQWAERRKDEQKVQVFHIHAPAGRMYLSFSGNTELGAPPNSEQNRMLLSLLGSSKEVFSQSSLLNSRSFSKVLTFILDLALDQIF